MDPFAKLLSSTPYFKGKWRLQNFWCRLHRAGVVRQAEIAGSLRINCELRIPYEAGIWLGQEENADLATLQTLLKPGQTFIDCGANIGLWTLHAAALVGAAGAVHAFEPAPATFRKLQENIALNELGQTVHAHQSALGRATGQAGISCNELHNLNQVVEGVLDGEVIQVPMETLDNFFGAYENSGLEIHGMKIDVEGYEAQVLAGGAGLLARQRPWICIEFNPDLCQSSRLGDWEPHIFLTAAGYTATFMAAPARKIPLSFCASRYLNILYTSCPEQV